MIIDCAKYSCRGGHSINEDSVFCGRDLFIVADGLGGHGNGSQASSAAVGYISGNYHGRISDEEISCILEGANAEVKDLDNGSRTTVAALFFNDDSARFANVGDSRVYYFRKGSLIAMTKDHSVCQASVDMGELSFEEIRFNSDRSRLMKVLGNDSQLNIKKLYDTIEVMDGDAFIVCSDGFWEYVYEQEMEADLLKAESADMWMRGMLKRHLLAAENNGDNYSVICGIIRSDKKPTADISDFPKTLEIAVPEKKAQGIRSSLMLGAVIMIILASVYLLMQHFGEKPHDDGLPVNDEVTILTEIPDETESDIYSEETSLSHTDETSEGDTSAESSLSESAETESTYVTEISSETSVCETETDTQAESETTVVCETETDTQTENSEETSTSVTPGTGSCVIYPTGVPTDIGVPSEQKIPNESSDS